MVWAERDDITPILVVDVVVVVVLVLGISEFFSCFGLSRAPHERASVSSPLLLALLLALSYFNLQSVSKKFDVRRHDGQYKANFLLPLYPGVFRRSAFVVSPCVLVSLCHWPAG